MGKYMYKVVNVDDSSYFVQPGSSFYLKYKKGAHVKAPKGSLGIMLFNTRARAEKFISRPLCRKIKRVLPIGEATVPFDVSRWPSRAELISKFNKMTLKERAYSVACTMPPRGTVCYPEVIVVD